MILIREVQKKDIEGLVALAHTPGMFNLPTTSEGMRDRVELSRKSFEGKVREIYNTKYVFVAEDLKNGKVLATSMIAGQHGTESSPHYYFKVGTEKHFSEAIQTGFIHGTLFLKTQTNGPSELGALVVDEASRNRDEKIGRQIFFSRFLYLYQNKQKFKDEILAELLPPLNKKGNSPLWEAVGRRFTNLDYWEADSLSAQNKDFIFDLFPQGKIYTTFLPADARNAIGKVGKETEPVLHLLKRIGFTYQNEIDPFDGGPHLRAKVNDISVLKKVVTVKLEKSTKPIENEVISGLITSADKKDDFMAVSISGRIEGKKFFLEPSYDLVKIKKVLKLAPQGNVTFLPYF